VWLVLQSATSGELVHHRGQAGPGGDAELVIGVPEVSFEGGLGDEQVLGDLPVGQAVRGQPGDFPFGAGECVGTGERGRRGRAPAASGSCLAYSRQSACSSGPYSTMPNTARAGSCQARFRKITATEQAFALECLR
jgi:hypothetical protein